MKLSIQFKNLKGDGPIISHIDHKFSFVFARSQHSIESAAITLKNINDPKGGIDKLCQIVIKPVGLGKIVVTEKRQHLTEAIDHCLHRASQSLDRKLKRRHKLSKRAYRNAAMFDLPAAT
ncbi:MAG: hypothetical protein AseanaTS_07440 [Candidatus Pelagadaptatus aseana]|uniref:HPF/RaiA family ribosome-associated protein n=1 Tax=Candidatus Pelagadaptatus aseana TaxID=3120508 RepID=UPI0039B13333